jgi:hypothetical protein
MQRLEQAVVGLEQALSSTPQLQPWRHIARRRLSAVRKALTAERTSARGEVWLSARAGHLHRERNRLLSRVTALGGLLSTEAVADEPLRQNLHRLAIDLHHHQQRLNDMAYDSVGMEVGGSE